MAGCLFSHRLALRPHQIFNFAHFLTRAASSRQGVLPPDSVQLANYREFLKQ